MLDEAVVVVDGPYGADVNGVPYVFEVVPLGVVFHCPIVVEEGLVVVFDGPYGADVNGVPYVFEVVPLGVVFHCPKMFCCAVVSPFKALV